MWTKALELSKSQPAVHAEFKVRLRAETETFE